MNPNNVNKLLKSLIADFVLPVTLFNCGPLLISEDRSKVSRERLEDIAQQWMDLERGDSDKIPQVTKEWFYSVLEFAGLRKNHRNHRISVGRTVSDICVEIERLALETSQVTGVRKVLKSLIIERELPFKIFHKGFYVIILPEDPALYRDEEMIELETLLDKENLEVQVRHSGFSLTRMERAEYDIPDIPLSQIQEMVRALQALLKRHDLKACLLHEGFVLEKKRKVEIHVSETAELASRLSVMTGIHYRGAGAYGMGLPDKDIPPGWTHKINWKHSRISASRPY